jgi:hypothetical protein
VYALSYVIKRFEIYWLEKFQDPRWVSASLLCQLTDLDADDGSTTAKVTIAKRDNSVQVASLFEIH